LSVKKTAAKAAAKARPKAKTAPKPKAAKPAPKAKVKAAALTAPAQASERPALWRLALLLGLGASLAVPLKSILATKMAQHVYLHRTVPILEQGDVPGRLSGVIGMKGDAEGGVAAISRSGDGFRVQRFDPSLTLTAHVEIPAKTLEIADLAFVPGGILLAGADGRVLLLDDKLKPQGKPSPSGLTNVVSVDSRDGIILALDPMNAAVGRLDAKGRLAGPPLELKQASGARNLAMLSQGGFALLLPRGSACVAAVFDAAGKQLRSFTFKDVGPASPVRMASMGEVLAVNDATGAIGLSFYRSSGEPLGNCIGIDHDVVAFPGFIAGDPLGRFAYVHFGAGLLKVALPWQEPSH
jgi:hypothetical protein